MTAASTAKTASLLRPRLLAIHLLGLCLVAAMVALGWWQLGRYDAHRQQAVAASLAAAADAAPQPLDRVLPADAAFPAAGVGVKVQASGHYAVPAQQFYVRRPLAGRPGYWVVTPLRIGRSAVLVVRGWTGSQPTAPPAVPAGSITVTGWLQPPEPLRGPVRLVRPAARVVPSISTAALVARVPFDLYSGYVVLSAQRPPAAATSLAVVPQPIPDAAGGSGWRNLAYASQWWVFAAFLAFMWWRIVRDARVA